MEEARTNPCGICGKPVPYQGHGRPQAYCSPEHKSEFRERRRREAYDRNADLARYGLTPEAFAQLLEEQNYKCAICKQPNPPSYKNWHVDHDHSCCQGRRSCGKCIRGLLCGDCNFGIGKFHDDPQLLLAAIHYLESPRSRQYETPMQRQKRVFATKKRDREIPQPRSPMSDST